MTWGLLPVPYRIPALLDFPDTTVVLRPGLGLVVEPGGNLTIEMED